MAPRGGLVARGPRKQVADLLVAGLVLATLGFGFEAPEAISAAVGLVAVLTLLSIAFYLAEWVRHINSAEDGR